MEATYVSLFFPTDKNLVWVWLTHTYTRTHSGCGLFEAAYVVADTLTCGDWLKLETKAVLKSSLAPLKVFIFHNTTGARFLSSQHPLHLTLFHDSTFLRFNLVCLGKGFHFFFPAKSLLESRHQRQRKSTESNSNAAENLVHDSHKLDGLSEFVFSLQSLFEVLT